MTMTMPMPMMTMMSFFFSFRFVSFGFWRINFLSPTTSPPLVY